MTAADVLSGLLAPLEPAVFLRDYFDRRPLHLAGDCARGAGLLGLESVVQAAAAEEGGGRVLLREAAFAAEAVPSAGFAASLGCRVQRGTEAVWAYLEGGHPLVWNGARGASPALDALTAGLARAFGAHVWPNVYVTGEAGTALDTHFDPHDVLVVQCLGRKQWQVSEVRVNCPLDLPTLRPTISRALELRREEAVARPLLTFVAEPGDIVYIPRGQFHNALALGGLSLHVTFAIAPPTGVEFLEALARLAFNEALFREYLPLPMADPDGSRLSRQVERLVARLLELARGQELAPWLERIRDEMVARSSATEA